MEQLTSQCLNKIFLKLELLDFLRCSLVCHRFYNLTHQEHLCWSFLKRTFGLSPKDLTELVDTFGTYQLLLIEYKISWLIDGIFWGLDEAVHANQSANLADGDFDNMSMLIESGDCLPIIRKVITEYDTNDDINICLDELNGVEFCLDREDNMRESCHILDQDKIITVPFEVMYGSSEEITKEWYDQNYQESFRFRGYRLIMIISYTAGTVIVYDITPAFMKRFFLDMIKAYPQSENGIEVEFTTSAYKQIEENIWRLVIENLVAAGQEKLNIIKINESNDRVVIL